MSEVLWIEVLVAGRPGRVGGRRTFTRCWGTTGVATPVNGVFSGAPQAEPLTAMARHIPGFGAHDSASLCPPGERSPDHVKGVRTARFGKSYCTLETRGTIARTNRNGCCTIEIELCWGSSSADFVSYQNGPMGDAANRVAHLFSRAFGSEFHRRFAGPALASSSTCDLVESSGQDFLDELNLRIISICSMPPSSHHRRAA